VVVTEVARSQGAQLSYVDWQISKTPSLDGPRDPLQGFLRGWTRGFMGFIYVQAAAHSVLNPDLPVYRRRISLYYRSCFSVLVFA
jgi:hypothetical protein